MKRITTLCFLALFLTGCAHQIDCTREASQEATNRCAAMQANEPLPTEKKIEASVRAKAEPGEKGLLDSVMDSFTKQLTATVNAAGSMIGSGTMRPEVEAEETREQRKVFNETLPVLSAEKKLAEKLAKDSVTADKKMDDTYREVLADFKGGEPGVEEAVRISQRAWITYRESAIGLAQARWKGKIAAPVVSKAVTTLLSHQRMEALDRVASAGEDD